MLDPPSAPIAPASDPSSGTTVLDRFMAWPGCVALVVLVIIGVAASFDELGGWLIALMLLATIWLPASLAALGAIGFLAWHRKWRRVLSLLPLPLVAALAVFAPSPTMRAVAVAGDYVRLVVGYPIYASRIVATSDAGPRFAKIDWGGTGFAGIAGSDIYLVYDASDEIVDVHHNGSASSRLLILSCDDFDTADPTTRGDQCFVVRHMLGHFYRVQCWDRM